MAELENDLHERFCNEYLIDLNATKAYLRADNDACTYDSAKNYANKLLQNITIRSRVRELMDARSKDTLVDAKFVVDGLTELYFKCLQVKPVEEWDDTEKRFVEKGTFEFDSHGASKALELLGKHVAMFTDKTEVKTTGGIKVLLGKEPESPADGLEVNVNG